MPRRRSFPSSKPLTRRRPLIERLEQRWMLTTLHTGDIFEFSDVNGNLVRIAVDKVDSSADGGDVTAEFIGASLGESGQTILHDLPGTLNGTDVLGGIGGKDGIELIGGIDLTDPVNGQNIPFDPAGSPDLEINAIACDSAGNLYGFNVVTRTIGTASVSLVQLVRFNTTNGDATVVAELSDAILTDPLNSFDAQGGAVTVKSVEASEFNPVNGLLYFVASGGASDLPQLYTVNVNAGNAAAIATSVQAIQGTFGASPAIPATLTTPAIPADPVVIKSIVFDQTGPGTVILNAYAHVDILVPSPGGQFNTIQTIPQIFSVDPTNSDSISARVRVRLDGVDVMNITGLAYGPDDPTAAEPEVLAITSATEGAGPTPSLLSINRATGACFVRGPLPDPDDLDAPIRGNDLQGLTFDPNLPDPLTGALGTLVATDGTSDELVRLSIGDRFPLTDLFSIYVTQSDQNSLISIAEFPKPEENIGNAMRPFEFSIGKLDVSTLDPVRSIVADANTGCAYLGLRTLNSETSAFGAVPITTGTVTSALGVLPLSITTLNAGLTVANGQDFGRFLFGGTVTGQVDFTGSVDTFYAGWLLTGQTQGQSAGDPAIQNNFHVSGDIRQLLVKDSIGTDTDNSTGLPHYSSGFDLEVGGKLGEIRSLDAIAGPIHVAHAPGIAGYTNAYQEFESFATPASFQDGFIADAGFKNDSFDTPEYLASFRNPDDGTQIAQVKGDLEIVPGDKTDFYALGLMANQTVTVRVLTDLGAFGGIGPFGSVGVNVYDPDGRLFASDTSDIDSSAVNEQAFSFKADRPGAYRFEVTGVGQYQLTITGTDDVALGGAFAGGNIFHGSSNPTFTVDRGDVGQIVSDATIYFARGPAHDVVVSNGNLRSVDAAILGLPVDIAGLGMSVPNGSIGLLRARSGAANLDLVDTGHDLQTIDVSGQLFVNMRAGAGLGVIRAGDMASDFASTIVVNADNTGFDGTIDLIDVTGDFGTLGSGGPHITTNTGGNVRYIRVGGTVYRDTFFGGAEPDAQIHNPGETVSVHDDGGGQIVLTPTGSLFSVPNANNPLLPATTTSGTVLTTTVYGIRGSGGVVLVKVAVAAGTPLNGTAVAGSVGSSVEIKGNGISGNSAVEVGVVDLSGAGSGASVLRTVDSKNNAILQLDPSSTADLSLNIGGDSNVDIFSIIGGAFNRISNSTKGEIVNVTATSIGELVAETLGLTKNTIGVAVNGINVVSDALPFNSLRNGIVVSGDIALARSRRGLGNFVVSGDIGQLRPNYDGSSTAGVFEGINAPIFTGGDQLDVNIGEGILPSGTGSFFLSGLYANGVIHKVTNQGTGSDIRGNIVSTVVDGIHNITLTNGAIINANIEVVSSFDMALEQTDLITIPSSPDPINKPQTFDIGKIILNGSGGIIGTMIRAADIGQIRVDGGFGILNSEIRILGDGRINSIRASGFGIRSTSIRSGSQLGELRADGNGSLASTASYTQSVRQSETGSIDPFFGLTVSSLTDLHAFLGTSAAAPVIAGVTDTGVIEDVRAVGQGDLGTVRAFTIRERASGNAPVNAQEYAMEFNFSNSVKSIKTTSIIDGLAITAGKLKEFKPAGDVSRLGITIAGKISSIKLPGSLSGNSFIRAAGPDGRIDDIRINGNLDGNVSATGKIKKLEVKGAISGGVNIDGLSQRSKVIDELKISGIVANGALTINGSVGKIKTSGSLGAIGDVLTIAGNLDELNVKGNLFSNVAVQGSLKKAKIAGVFASGVTMTVASVLKSIDIRGDFQAGAVIEAGEVRKKKVNGLDLGTVVIL